MIKYIFFILLFSFTSLLSFTLSGDNKDYSLCPPFRDENEYSVCHPMGAQKECSPPRTCNVKKEYKMQESRRFKEYSIARKGASYD